MRYATLGGGKRVRPLLAFAAGELTGAAPDARHRRLRRRNDPRLFAGP
jgi:geranylgeranyl pyrophosphate synthase